MRRDLNRHRRLLEKDLDDGHKNVRTLDRQDKHGVLRRKLRLGEGVLLELTAAVDHLELRPVAEELRVGDATAEALQVHVLERPGEEMQVEPVAALRVAAVGGRSQGAAGWAVNRPAVQVQ